MTMTKWTEIASVPQGTRFDMLPQDQGQVVEVAYSLSGAGTADPTRARYRRVTDTSCAPGPGRVRYYIRAGRV